MSASSHRPFPCLCHGNENLWDGMGGILTTTGFPPLCAMCHVPAEGEFPNFARGFLRPPRRGVPNHEPEPLGEFEGACPLMHAPPRAAKPQARSDPKSRRTDSGTLSARPLFRR